MSNGKITVTGLKAGSTEMKVRDAVTERKAVQAAACRRLLRNFVRRGLLAGADARAMQAWHRGGGFGGRRGAHRGREPAGAGASTALLRRSALR